MALITCPECKNKISSTASSCPKCGYKIKAAGYGVELGKGIKEGMQGLNTMASPKKRKTCMLMILVPLVLFILFFFIGISTDNDNIASIGIVFGLCLGVYQFYVGKFKKGIMYTITFGGLIIGALADLFKLVATKTFKDSNGFPLIY